MIAKKLWQVELTYKKAKKSVLKEVIDVGLFDPNKYDNKGLLPLHVAVEKEKYLLAKSLLQNGVDMNARTSFFEKTALAMAIKKLLPDMVKIVLDHNADLHKVNRKKSSALWHALKRDHKLLQDRTLQKVIVDLILQHGIESRDKCRQIITSYVRP